MRRASLGMVLLVVLAISFAIQGQPEEIELVLEQGLNEYEGTRDTTIYEGPENSNGGGSWIFAGNAGNRNPRRSLIQFDISQIPEGSTINAVSIQLVVTRTTAPPSDQSFHRLLKDWGEGEVDAGGNEGSGARPEEGDATWSSNFLGTSEWENPGGDFVEEASATVNVAGVGSVVEWSGEGLVADVQAWIDGTEENFGWILIGDENAFGSAKRYNSSENADVEEGERPRLTIRYTPPSE